MPKTLTAEQAQKIAAMNKPTESVRASLQAAGYDVNQGMQMIQTVGRSAQKPQDKQASPAQTQQPQSDDTFMGYPTSELEKTMTSDEGWTQPGKLAAGSMRDLGHMAKGLYGGAKDTLSGLGNIVSHPIDTISNIGDAVTHPMDTAGGMMTGAKNLATKTIPEAFNDPEKAGNLAGSAMTLGALSKPIGALEGAGTAGKIASKVGKAATTGVAAPSIMAAADPSLKDKSPQQKAEAIGEAAGATAVGKGIDLGISKAIGVSGVKLPVSGDTELLKTEAGRAMEDLRARGIRVSESFPMEKYVGWLFGKAGKFAGDKDAFMKNAGTGRGDLVEQYAKMMEVDEKSLRDLGYTEQELQKIKLDNGGANAADALGDLASKELTPAVLNASNKIISDRYNKFWQDKSVVLKLSGMRNMWNDLFGSKTPFKSGDDVKQFEKYIDRAAPGLLDDFHKLHSQKMTGEEFQRMRSQVSSAAHDVSASANSATASAQDKLLRPVADALHIVKEHLDKMADEGLAPAQRKELTGMRKTYQAVADFKAAWEEGKLKGNVYMSPTDLVDYVRRSNPSRFKAGKDDVVKMGRAYDTLGIESKPRGLVTKYGTRRYARDRDAAVAASAEQEQRDGP